MVSMLLAARTSRAVAKAGSGEGVSVFGEEERAGGVLRGTVFDDSLGDGGDVVVVERGGEGTAAMAGGAEGDALGGDRGIGMQSVVSGEETREIDQVCGKRMVAGLVGWIGAHAFCPSGLLSIFATLWATIWDAGCRREWRGSRMIRRC